jgi:hypothetical protein
VSVLSLDATWTLAFMLKKSVKGMAMGALSPQIKSPFHFFYEPVTNDSLVDAIVCINFVSLRLHGAGPRHWRGPLHLRLLN